MGDEGADIDKLMESAAELQDILDTSDFYMIDTRVEEVARGVGLTDLGLDSDVDDLSGGQRTKILLAKMLLQNPDILLLDEPTNYLDEEHIAWLKEYLLKYENAFILISHDMEFLNDVVNIIYHVENAHITRYVGDYNEFLRLYELGKKQLEAAYNRQQNEINSLQTFIAKIKPEWLQPVWQEQDRKSLIKWTLLNWQKKSQSQSLDLLQEELQTNLFLKQRI